MLASGLANFVAGEKIKNFWVNNPFDILSPKKSDVQEINHALTTYLKAKGTDDA